MEAGTILAIEPRRRLDIVAADEGRRHLDILVFGGLLNEPAFKGRSAEGLALTLQPGQIGKPGRTIKSAR